MRCDAVGLIRRLSPPVALLAVAPAAHAQEADHTDRGDVADFREHDDGRPEPYERGLDGRPRASWTLEAGAPVVLDTNPFWAAGGSPDALLVTPSLALDYAHPQLMPGWDLELRARADADIFSRDPDELNEARLEAAATLFHRIGDAGTLSFGFRNRWSYTGKDFGDFDQSQQRYTAVFAADFASNLWASLGFEYRHSTDPSQRRAIGTASFDWSIETGGVRVGLFQELAFSDFVAGSNDGRRDLLSLSELSLTPALALPPGMRLGLTASLFHRFSNRETARFTAVQVGPNIRLRF